MSTFTKYSLGIVLTIFIFLTSRVSYSQDTACGKVDTTIYYGNGVHTTIIDALIDEDQLLHEVWGAVPEEEREKISGTLAYNTTNGWIGDLLESTIQDLSTDVTSFWKILRDIVPMPESFRAKLLEAEALIDNANLEGNQDLSNHVNFYKKSILEGKKVILVSHSQGNFFGNRAYGRLSETERKSFGIVSVANPDSTVGGNGPYTTLIEDLVILAIRIAKQKAGLPFLPLEPNETNFPKLTSLAGHSFIGSYLAPDSRSKARILKDIVNVRDGLLPPETAAGQGIITVSLTWGHQPDVDLHAFEPNGAHVYYRNLVGPSGHLDKDDTDGDGPEHYTVDCDTLETGNYRIGVNYFDGDAPEVANVAIQAGLQARSFSIFLPTALGSSGNESPMPVGTIVVNGSSEDGFDFSIQ